MCVCACVRACWRACVCVFACVYACLCVCCACVHVCLNSLVCGSISQGALSVSSIDVALCRAIFNEALALEETVRLPALPPSLCITQHCCCRCDACDHREGHSCTTAVCATRVAPRLTLGSCAADADWTGVNTWVTHARVWRS